MDTVALDAMPELYRQVIAAVDRVGALVGGGTAPAEIAFAAAELADFRAAIERAAGKVLAEAAGIVAATSRQRYRDGWEQRDAELAAAPAPVRMIRPAAPPLTAPGRPPSPP